jgi:eukaryotic-like serine/threonine-protein kinase
MPAPAAAGRSLPASGGATGASLSGAVSSHAGGGLPERIGRFEVSRVLGKGAQSVVYLARDPMLEREVAIKALPTTRSADAPQLLAEARIAGRLRHPHIVPAFDVGEHDAHPYLVFEFVDGDTLAGHLKQHGAFTPRRAATIMVKLLDAIAYAHEQGVVHRDLKPANIMVDDEDFPRVMDFGIAMRVADGSARPGADMTLVGTPAYMAPEYVHSGVSAASNDVFACGLLLAEMLTGRRVIVAASAIEAIHALLNDPIEMPDAPQAIDERLSAIARRAIARRPDERFASAAQMKSALEGWIDQLRAAEPDAPGSRAGNSTLEFLLRRMRHRTDFPALSTAISAVNRALASDSENISKLANTILQDFAITNKILRLVNSAGFSGLGGGRISTISRAVQILGFDQVRNIAVSLMLFEHLQNKAQANALRDEFVKTLFTGVLAREAAPKAKLRDPEEAFVCALFHDLGRLLCLFYFPEEWHEIRRLVTEERRKENDAAQRVLGASFEQLGVGTAEAWGFPPKIAHSMRALPEGPMRKAVNNDDGLRVVSGFASEVSAAASGPPGERAAAFARIGSRYKGALPFDADQVGDLVRQSLAGLSMYAAALNLNLAQSPLGRTLMSSGATANDVPGEAAASIASTDTDTTGFTVLKESADPAESGSDVAIDPQAALSSGIQDLSNALVDGMPMNEVLRIVLETMYRAIGFRRVVLCIRDVRENAMVGRFGFGDDAQAVAKRFRFPMQFKPDVFFAALSKNVDILIADIDDPKIAARVPDWYRGAVGAKTFIVFPLVVNEKPFGLIYADAEKAGAIDISPNVLKLLRTLRNQAVLAIKQGK